MRTSIYMGEIEPALKTLLADFGTLHMCNNRKMIFLFFSPVYNVVFEKKKNCNKGLCDCTVTGMINNSYTLQGEEN